MPLGMVLGGGGRRKDWRFSFFFCIYKYGYSLLVRFFPKRRISPFQIINIGEKHKKSIFTNKKRRERKKKAIIREEAEATT